MAPISDFPVVKRLWIALLILQYAEIFFFISHFMLSFSQNYVIDYANEYDKSTKKFVPWKAMVSRTPVSLFTFEDYSNVLHFKNEVIENDTGPGSQTLVPAGSFLELIDLANFFVRAVTIRLAFELEKYYTLAHVLVKDREGRVKRYIPEWVPVQRVYKVSLERDSTKLFTPVRDAFVFGLQYRYNDTCGVVMTEMQQSPNDSKVLQLTISGVYASDHVPTIVIKTNYLIKVNYYRKRISIYDPETKTLVAELSFARMKRKSFQRQDGNCTLFSFDIDGGDFFRTKLKDNIIDNVFDQIHVASGSLDLVSVCSCACLCNCNIYNVQSGLLYLSDNDWLKSNDVFSSVRLCCE